MQPRVLLLVCLSVLPLPTATLRRVHVKFEAPTTETLLPDQDGLMLEENYNDQVYHFVKVGSRAQLFPRRFVKKLATTTTTTTTQEPASSTSETLRCEDIAAMAQRYGIRDIPGFASQNCFLIRMYMPHVTCEEITLVVNYCFADGRNT